MNNIVKFEEQYTLLKMSVYGKPGYNQEVVSKALEESKNSLLFILNECNIDFDIYFTKELIDIYERRYNGNPNGLPFSDIFRKEIYSDYYEKLAYLDFLFEAHSLKKNVDYHLLKIAEKTLKDDEILHFYTLFDTFNMLYLKEVQNENVPFLFEVINLLIEKTNENHFSTPLSVVWR